MTPDEETLKTYINEQQRYHDELTSVSQSARNRIVTYVGALLALLVFLYSGALNNSQPVRERLFIPDELYGQILYFFALTMVVYALVRLINGIKPNSTWSVAVESKDIKVVERLSELEYLVKLKDDYDKTRIANLKEHSKKYSALESAFYPMLLGATLLVVLRYFQ